MKYIAPFNGIKRNLGMALSIRTFLPFLHLCHFQYVCAFSDKPVSVCCLIGWSVLTHPQTNNKSVWKYWWTHYGTSKPWLNFCYALFNFHRGLWLVEQIPCLENELLWVKWLWDSPSFTDIYLCLAAFPPSHGVWFVKQLPRFCIETIVQIQFELGGEGTMGSLKPDETLVKQRLRLRLRQSPFNKMDTSTIIGVQKFF